MATQSRTGGRRRKRSAPAGYDPSSDLNLIAAGLLRDMAMLQPNERSQLGYKRAAKAVVALPVLVTELVEADALREVPFIGPSSTRIITEVAAHGRSETVDKAVAASSKRDKVEAARALRRNFLSRVAMTQALASPLDASIVSKEVFRGDFQMHSTWSDGGERIETMVRACLELGHECLGITDHSYGLPIARGVSMSDIEKQHREIERINNRHEGRFRVFKGIEANILADGSLDLGEHERGVFEFIVASPHSLLRRSDDQTARMLTAVRQRGVTILGHPRGRIYDSRAGVLADWPRIFAEAARRTVAIEIDGNWHRQDVDFELAAQALEAGCLFALDSDAHSIPELRFTDYSIAHARVAGVPAERVINTWSNDRLDDWMRERRG